MAKEKGKFKNIKVANFHHEFESPPEDVSKLTVGQIVEASTGERFEVLSIGSLENGTHKIKLKELPPKGAA